MASRPILPADPSAKGGNAMSRLGKIMLDVVSVLFGASALAVFLWLVLFF